MFFVAKENGSVLLSCRTTMELGLITPRAHLDYLPPKARLLTSTCDQPSKTKFYKPVIHYKIHLDPKISPKQTPCRPVPVHLKHTFKAEINKMLKASVLKPVQEATLWINSFILVEGNDQHGQHKLQICLDPTNLNKAIVREPYHFKTLEDITHLLADATILMVLDCKKGYWHQQLDEESSYLMTFNTEFGRYRYTVMPFGQLLQVMSSNEN